MSKNLRFWSHIPYIFSPKHFFQPHKNCIHLIPHIFSTDIVGLLIQVNTPSLYPPQLSNPTDDFLQIFLLHISVLVACWNLMVSLGNKSTSSIITTHYFIHHWIQTLRKTSYLVVNHLQSIWWKYWDKDMFIFLLEIKKFHDSRIVFDLYFFSGIKGAPISIR